jgi:negative regulator of sigma E activity
VRYYFPDAKVVRIEPRTIRNVFPSLSPEQTANLAQYYDFKLTPGGRVAGRITEMATFEPRDWHALRASLLGRRHDGPSAALAPRQREGEAIEEFAFTDVSYNATLDKEMVRPSWTSRPSDWQVTQAGPGDFKSHETGWTVNKVPPGFIKISEGFRRLAGKRRAAAHLVFSDGSCAISVFVEPYTVTQTQIGLTQAAALPNIPTRSDRVSRFRDRRSAAGDGAADRAVGQSQQ